MSSGCIELATCSGHLPSTDYQAAQKLKSFLNEYMPRASTGDIDWAIRQGNLTLKNGETVELDKSTKAAFEKLAAENYSLFNRLDAGTTGERDQRVTTENIDDAVKSSWKLHVTGRRNRAKDTGLIRASQCRKAKLKAFLTSYFKEKGTLQVSVLQGIVSRRFESNHEPDINDPKIVQAAAVLLADLDNANKGGMKLERDEDWVNLEEIEAWDIS